MTQTACDVIARLAGKTLASAESMTSVVYKGGIISYCDEVKHGVLGVPQSYLSTFGAVSAPVAEAMVVGVRDLLRVDVAVSVTGLAGPSGDDFGNAVGTVFIGYADAKGVTVEEHHFTGDRESVRSQTIETVLQLLLKNA